MASVAIVTMLYLIDILYYMIYIDYWGIGKRKCYYCGNQFTWTI